MSIPVIEPKVLSLLTTMYCTAQCRNCCFQCSPKNRDSMSLNDMLFYIDKIKDNFHSIKTVVFSGGECTSLKEDLLNAISYSKKKGLTTRIVTNAFWATSYEKSYEFLNRLRQHGLDEINYSTGDDHQEWVPYDNIINACLAARDIGFNVLINVESHPKSSFNSFVFERDNRISKYIGKDLLDPNCIKIMQGVWMPIDEEAKQKREHIDVIPQYKPCDSLFQTLSIVPNGDIYCCCGLTCLKNSFLKIGNAHFFSKKDIISNQFDDLLKVWIHIEGPYKVLEFLYRNDPQKLSNIDYSMHVCEVCHTIFNDIQNIKDIKENILQVLPNIILKYNLSLKKKHYEKENL